MYNSIRYGGHRNGDDDDNATIEQVGNRIYFYADVEVETCMKLMKKVRELDTELRMEQMKRGLEDEPLTPIWLHVQSYGGDLFAGFSTADQLKIVKSPIYTVVDGITASAATLISMSGNKRYILPNSLLMIHQLRAFMWGTHEAFKDEMLLQEKLMDKLVSFYIEHSALESQDDIRDMLKHDYWLDAKTALERGFVDAILR